MNNIEIYESPSYILEAVTSINNENISLEIIQYSDTSIDILSNNAEDNISLSVLQSIDSTIEISTAVATLPSDYINSVDQRIGSIVTGGSGISVSYNPQVPSVVISATGLQPLGDYAHLIHNHQTQDIINFASGVSGLIPGISAGSGISIINTSNNYIIGVTGEFGLTGQQVDARVQNLLLAGPNIGLTFNSTTNKLTIAATGLQAAGNYSVNGHNHNIADISGLQQELNSKQPSGLYATINSPNFSGVPTVPTASSGSYSNQIANTTFVRNEILGLINSAPSTLDTLNELAIALNNDSNFATTVTNSLATKASLSGSNFTGNIGGPSANFSTILQNGIPVSISGHTHSIADISNLQQILDSKQPSGTYASSIHNHTVSDISNFNIAVSSLLPVKQIIAGSNISLINNSGDYTIGVSGQLGLTSEEVDDRVSSLLSAGSYISLNYNDNLDKLTLSVTGLQPSGNYSVIGHSHPISDISGLQASLDSKQVSGNYSLVGHNHTASNITDLNAATSGIINTIISTTISGSNGINVSYYSLTDTLLISTSGVSLLGHQHTSSEITDFTSSVRSNRLNDMTVPSGNVSFNNYRLTNLATAVSGTDAINKNYIDNLYASTSGLGIASFNSANFSVISGVVSVKASGIDNSKLLYSYVTLGSSVINLGSTVSNINGLILDGGSP